MIFVILTLGIAAAAVLGFLLGTQQAGPCACVSAGLPRPTYYGRHDGGIVVGERDEVLVRAPRHDVTGMPRRTPHPSAADPVTPARTDDRPPWYITTTQQTAIDDAPVYGEAPQLVVAAAQNPALRDQPVVPAYMSAPTGGTE